jgi:MYXO-CTERM domain-containing protein
VHRSTLRKTLAIVGATAMTAIAVPLLLTAPHAGAAPGDPVVTLEQGVAGCNGVRPTPGSGNTNKRLISGDLEPGGTVTFEISFPVDPSDVGGDFAITDCVFIAGKAALKYSVAFVPNNVNFLLTFNLTIPPDAPIGALYCNFAKTTQSPSTSQASNRKAGPACFRIGGNLRIIKVAEGDPDHTPLAGASFDVACTTGQETIPPVVISGLSGATTFSTGAYRASGTADTGIIAIAGPEGTPCTVTETAAPPGFNLPADPTFDFTIPAATAQQEIDFIEDPPVKNVTSIVTDATSGNIGDGVTDTATLSGATADAGGTITFNVYDNNECGGTPVFTDTVDVSGNGDYTSGVFTADAPGTYYWIASYSGDDNNQPSSGSCRDEGETSTLTPTATPTPTVSTSGTITHSPPTTPPTSPSSSHGVASTGAGPINDELNWALALLVLGAAAVYAGRRRYRRLH